MQRCSVILFTTGGMCVGHVIDCSSRGFMPYVDSFGVESCNCSAMLPNHCASPLVCVGICELSLRSAVDALCTVLVSVAEGQRNNPS